MSTIHIIGDPVYKVLSNFWPCTIRDEKTGIVFGHSEGYYMWHKCKNPEYRKIILNCRDAKDAKYHGSERGMKANGFKLRSDWDEGDPPFKLKVMRRVVPAKFQQNPILAEILCSTGTAKIIENAPWSEYWGYGRTGKGKNMLGRILMLTRKGLRDGSIVPYNFTL